jgi:glycerophosphoryl diester phosphodiesterase
VSHPALPPGPVAIAHRGGSLEAEENTMEAFARAVGLGYRDIETDVHATRDGVAVIHHDATLARMTGDPRAIAGMDWAELSRVRTHGGAAIPRLDETLAAFPEVRFVLELKAPRSAEALAPVVREAGALDRIAVGAFEPRHTAEARARLGDGLLWSPGRPGVLALWLQGWGLPLPRPAFRVIHVPPAFRGIAVVTPRLVRAAARHGVAVQVWTVDEAAEMERLLDMGVHAVMTDRPTVLREVMRRRGAWAGG